MHSPAETIKGKWLNFGCILNAVVAKGIYWKMFDYKLLSVDVHWGHNECKFLGLRPPVLLFGSRVSKTNSRASELQETLCRRPIEFCLYEVPREQLIMLFGLTKCVVVWGSCCMRMVANYTHKVMRQRRSITDKYVCSAKFWWKIKSTINYDTLVVHAFELLFGNL